MILTSQSLGLRRLGETRRSLAFRHSIEAGSDRTLALDLQFQRDAAFVSRRGPLPTFTRASAAWRVNSAGLIVPAAVNEPRPDYDPTTLVSLGIKNEPQSTNRAVRSEQPSNATWIKSETTALDNQGTAPDGNSTLGLISETTANSQHFVQTPSSVSTIGVTYTSSIFLKKGTGATAPDWILLVPAWSNYVGRVAFNLSTGTVGATAGSTTYTVKGYPNGVWRVTLTDVATVGFSGIGIFGTNNTNTTSAPTYAGLTTSNYFVWGVQDEALDHATSYIPTTSAAVVRSADLFSYTGGAFSGFWNASEGTMVFQGMKASLPASGFPNFVGADDGTGANRILLYGAPTVDAAVVSVASVDQAGLYPAPAVAVNTAFGMAMRYKANDFALSRNGAAVLTDAAGAIPTVNQMTIGNRLGAAFLSGWIRSVQYYNRTKTNAQLQLLSTPS